MKRTMFVLTLLVPYLTFSQYYAQNVSEKNFEESQIYFDSYYLNPFGLYSFKDVTPGMLNDPFLNMHINPAIIPDLESKAFRFYIDFRGDRKPEQTMDVYPPIPLYGEGSFVPVPVYNYYSGKQYEPEPLLSAGIISHPVKELGKKFYVAGTYQIIRRDEGHFSSPYQTYYIGAAKLLLLMLEQAMCRTIPIITDTMDGMICLRKHTCFRFTPVTNFWKN